MLSHWLLIRSIPVAIWTLWHKFKRLYLLNKRHFLNFLLQFWNVHEISNILNIKLSILANLFPKLYIPIELITETSKRSCFRTPFSKQRLNGFQTLLESAGHYYYLIFSWISEILNSKKSLLVWFVILRLFVKSLTADNKYSRCNLDTLTQIQTPLSFKQKTFCEFFIAVLKCAWNFEHFE